MMAFGAGSKTAERIAVKALAAKALAAGVSALAFATAFAVQPAAAQSQAAAARTATVNVSVPAGSLESGLLALGRQANLKLLYQTAIAAGKTTQGVSGTMSPQAAVGRLLAGSGLNYTFTAANVVSIQAPSAVATGAPEGAIALNTIDVNGAGHGADGFVAITSSAATKTDTPIIETPQAISVVTRKQMDAQGAESVAQALDYTSGVLSEQRGVNTSGFEYITGRGFQLEKYLDGMRLPDVAYNVPSYEPYTLERIEVLHGPASVLYGQSFPGGLINLVSKRPTEQAFGEIKVMAGTYDLGGTAFDLGGPVDKDGKFLYRLTGLFRNDNTQVDYTREQRLSIAPAFTYKPDGDTTLTLLTNYQNDPYAGYYNFVPGVGTVLPNPNGTIARSLNPGEPGFDKHSREQFSLGYLFEHRFDETWTARQSVRYTHINDNLQNVFSNGLASDNATLNRYAFFNDESLGQWTTDNQIEARFSTGPVNHTTILGLDYQHIDYKELYGMGFNVPGLNVFNPIYGAPVAIPTPTGSDNASLDQLGLYAQDQMSLDNWRFMISGREDWANSDDYDHINQTNSAQSDHAFTWRTGLVYLFDNGLAPYGSYATSFQPQIGQSFSGAAFQPTTAEQFEIGLKYQPVGFNAFMTVAAFNLTQHNVLTADSAPGHTGFSVQTGAIRSRGVEVEAHASLTSNLDLVASYTYLDNIVTSSNETDSPYDLDEGKRPTGIPRNTAALWTNYTFKDSEAAGLGAGAGVRYVGFTYGTNSNVWGAPGYEYAASKVPAYTLVDAVISYDFGVRFQELKGFSASINARNLFDKKYVAYCQSVSLCQYGNGRTVLAALTYRW